jgi:hypothetical protein
VDSRNIRLGLLDGEKLEAAATRDDDEKRQRQKRLGGRPTTEAMPNKAEMGS